MRVAPLDAHDHELRRAAARQLVDEFREHWPDAWPTLEDAETEVGLALAPEKVALAALDERGTLLGWVGALPMYDGAVWELHPLVVGRAHQGRGVGRALVRSLEDVVRARGALTLWLGTDDQAGLTSVGGVDLFPNLLEKLATLAGDPRHPLGFWRAVGFEVAGVVPDASGPGQPDILMAKRVRPWPTS